jgi:eukaryotic-like serine/threonine-protein kinase
MRPNVNVKDDEGRQHQLTEKLGVGGQGTVFLTADERFVVKVLSLPETGARERWRQQLSSVLTLPLEDLRVSRPLRLLASPHVGYVMQRIPKAQSLAALSEVPHGTADAAAWYLETGGLRRRLKVLARMAGVLRILHDRGLVYGDPSPANVLFDEEEQVHLIDVDNLVAVARHQPDRVLTPWFAAPEVYAGRSGVNTLTDAFAFATMAFQTLTLVHPFLGDAVHAAGPAAEESALRGEWPWVDHPDDARNRASHGLPRSEVLTAGLHQLAAQTFEEGSSDPSCRPGLESWEQALWEAADRLLRCGDCAQDSDFEHLKCLWCGTCRSGFVRATAHIADPETMALALQLKLPPVVRTLGTLICSTELPSIVQPRHLTGSLNEIPLLELTFDGERLQVRSLDHQTAVLRRALLDKEDVPVEAGGRHKRFPLMEGQSAWQLHLGELDNRHRYLTFDRVMGVDHASV